MAGGLSAITARLQFTNAGPGGELKCAGNQSLAAGIRRTGLDKCRLRAEAKDSSGGA